jgi:DNA-binding beta-propeller fold protein YncE
MKSRAPRCRPSPGFTLATSILLGLWGHSGNLHAGTLVEPVDVLYAPIRIAEASDGRLFITDSKSNSLFVLHNLLTEAELQDLDRPLGVAVDATGNIYVGNDGRDNVEVYDPTGNKLRDIGTGTIQMPNDLALDLAGNLYVADSLANNVQVYAPTGELLRTIGDNLLEFPVSVTVAYSVPGGGGGELYVADQGHAKIQVFDLSGTPLRSYGQRLELEETDWHGKFVQIQSLAVDQMGRLHVLDSALSNVQILDPLNGAYLDSYASMGTAEGLLYLPLDIVITAGNQTMVTNNGNHRIDMILDMNPSDGQGEQ